MTRNEDLVSFRHAGNYWKKKKTKKIKELVFFYVMILDFVETTYIFWSTRHLDQHKAGHHLC